MEQFNKFIIKQQFALLEYSPKSRDNIIGLYRTAWKAALKWIFYDGVLENTLAGDLIKEELNGN